MVSTVHEPNRRAMKVICPSRPPTTFIGLQSWNPRKTSTMNLKPQKGGGSIKGAEMSIGAGDCHPEAVSAPSTAPTLHPLPTLLPGCRDREPQEATPRTPRRGAGGGGGWKGTGVCAGGCLAVSKPWSAKGRPWDLGELETFSHVPV